MIALSSMAGQSSLLTALKSTLNTLARVCQINPLTVSQILSPAFLDIRKKLETHHGLFWSLTWLKIVRKSPCDETFSCDLDHFSRVTNYIISIAENFNWDFICMATGEKLYKDYDPSQIVKELEHKIHKIVLAKIYRCLLRLAKNNREQALLRHEKFEPGIIGKLEHQESRLWSIEQIIHQKTSKFINNYFPQ